MKLYRYSEVSMDVEEAEAVQQTGYPEYFAVRMHATVECGLLPLLLINWDYAPAGALDKYIKQQTEEAQTHLSNAMYAKSLK